MNMHIVACLDTAAAVVAAQVAECVMDVEELSVAALHAWLCVLKEL